LLATHSTQWRYTSRAPCGLESTESLIAEIFNAL
jgi:hypothetical protein